MEEFVDKIQQEMSKFDREYLRKIQGDMFRCSANCCDNTSSSQQELQKCLEKCSAPAMKSDRFMQEQMQDMQDRFQRCAMACNDKIKDKLSLSGSQEDNVKHRAEMESCVNKCGQEMITLIPTYTKKMKEWFTKGYYLQ